MDMIANELIMRSTGGVPTSSQPSGAVHDISADAVGGGGAGIDGPCGAAGAGPPMGGCAPVGAGAAETTLESGE